MSQARGVLALLRALEQGRALRYAGEQLSHWDHALQTAALAMQAQATASLVVAALLHDIGHLVNAKPGDTPSLRGQDDGHETLAAAWLEPEFGHPVSEPVRLHVLAKRYLVARDPGYGSRLSADSQRSLGLQGGPMSAAECDAFLGRPYAREALRLRVWDDLAKDPSMPPQRLERFLPAVHAARLPCPTNAAHD